MKIAHRNFRPYRTEIINFTKSGEEFWVDLDKQPIVDSRGIVTRRVAVARDASDRKLSVNVIASSEDWFRLIASATNDIIWDRNLEISDM